MLIYHEITSEQLISAHSIFMEKEPRDLFYRAAIYLVRAAINKEGVLSLAEAVSVLLQTWNRSFYRFNTFTNEHFLEIEELLETQMQSILYFNQRIIQSLSENDNSCVPDFFKCFELVLGPTGAAKTLHLLSPNFFSLWDQKIANAYGVRLNTVGMNGDKYFAFMKCQKEQITNLEKIPEVENVSILKLIDEYNYCHFTKHWI